MYPIKIKASSDYLDHIALCEPQLDELLQRFRTRIVINNDDELRTIYRTIGKSIVGDHRYRCTKKLLDDMRPFVKKIDPSLAYDYLQPAVFY